MTLFLVHDPDEPVVQLMASAVTEDAIGDLTVEVEPGGSAFGRPYQFWAALPDGPYELEDPSPDQSPSA